MFNHGLTERQLEIIWDILSPHADCIERVGLFGSRATGTARPNSDIDTVLYGNIEEALLDRLRTSFDSSGLPMKVDLVAYDLAKYQPLKTHIDNVRACS